MHQPFQGDLFARGEARREEQPQIVTTDTARIYAFPPCRNIKLVAKLLAQFQLMLRQYDRKGAKRAFDKKYLDPLRAKLARLGVPPMLIEQEVYALKAAIRDLSWRTQEDVA